MNQEGVYLQGDLVVTGEAFEGYDFRRLHPEPSPKEEKENLLPFVRFRLSITKGFCPASILMCLGFGCWSSSWYPEMQKECKSDDAKAIELHRFNVSL